MFVDLNNNSEILLNLSYMDSNNILNDRINLLVFSSLKPQSQISNLYLKKFAVFVNGDTYEEDNNGVSTYRRKGDKYINIWKDSKLQNKGQIHSKIQNSFYEGSIENFLPHGWGVMTYHNGDRYEGNFYQGIRKGKGDLYYSNGDRIKGFGWENNELSDGMKIFKKGHIYTGSLCMGFPHGGGALLSPDQKHHYLGDFHMGKFHGDVHYTNLTESSDKRTKMVFYHGFRIQ